MALDGVGDGRSCGKKDGKRLGVPIVYLGSVLEKPRTLTRGDCHDNKNEQIRILIQRVK